MLHSLDMSQNTSTTDISEKSLTAIKSVVVKEVKKAEKRLTKRIDTQTKLLTGAIATLGNNVVSIEEFEELKQKVGQIGRRTKIY